MESLREIVCSHCHNTISLKENPAQHPLKFCIFCGSSLENKTITSTTEPAKETLSSVSSPPSLVHGHIPHENTIQFSIGPYQVLSNIGKGGMGEVLLAYDTNCGRRIALKRIRSDLLEHVQMHNRFLKEARITSQLTHPAIIPIYSIQAEKNQIYYTMPYVEGKTLRQILKETRALEKKGEKTEHTAGSIPSLVRIFLSIAQAVAYAHSKGVLHRDIKPENVIIGRYGEVLILDWGLAKIMRDTKNGIASDDESLHDIPPPHPLHGLTNLGKVVGTVAYMAPERALGHPATVQTDIYSLGVILYQILTLRYPFRRGTLKEYRAKIHEEVLVSPAEIAPYRDVPPILAKIALKSLSKDLSHRYSSVDEMIHDVENYIEGRSEWFQIAELDIHHKSDWEFQENVLMTEHIAITRGIEFSDWVSLMISRESYPENTKIEARVRIGEKGHGIGFLLSIPEASDRQHLNDGYCLWLGSDLNRSTKLLRSTVEVVHAPDMYLQRNEWYYVRVEKIDNNIYFYLNDILQFSYICHMPLAGTHIGLLSRDADFTISKLQVFVGSQNVTLNCLAVPDAFLAHKDYKAALTEYRRIGYSFPGRAEGREAMFRAGITLLEHARDNNPHVEFSPLYEEALEEFQKLHGTPGAPLEYLGKALVYQALRDYEEEIKCFELAFRRYPKHPLLPVLQEQIVYRMHESSRFHRLATYNFILLVIRHMQEVAKTNNARKLFTSLEKHWEPLHFIEEDPNSIASDSLKNHFFAIQLAFWLAKPYVLVEIIDELLQSHPSSITLGNALFCLIELGAWHLAKVKSGEISLRYLDNEEIQNMLAIIGIAILCHELTPKEAGQAFLMLPTQRFNKQMERTALHIIECALVKEETATVHTLSNSFEKMEFSSLGHLYLNCARIWAFLLKKQWDKAGQLLLSYPLELLSQETTPLHFLYGCWLHVTEGKDIASIHFFGVMEVTYPRSWALFSHFLNGKIIEGQGWFEKAFLWEKRQIYKQLTLFYKCVGDTERTVHYQLLEKQQYFS